MASSPQSSSSLQQFLARCEASLSFQTPPRSSSDDVYSRIDFHPHVFAFLLNAEFYTPDRRL